MLVLVFEQVIIAGSVIAIVGGVLFTVIVTLSAAEQDEAEPVAVTVYIVVIVGVTVGLDD